MNAMLKNIWERFEAVEVLTPLREPWRSQKPPMEQKRWNGLSTLGVSNPLRDILDCLRTSMCIYRGRETEWLYNTLLGRAGVNKFFSDKFWTRILIGRKRPLWICRMLTTMLPRKRHSNTWWLERFCNPATVMFRQSKTRRPRVFTGLYIVLHIFIVSRCFTTSLSMTTC